MIFVKLKKVDLRIEVENVLNKYKRKQRDFISECRFQRDIIHMYLQEKQNFKYCTVDYNQ